MRIASIQIECVLGNVPANTAHMIAEIEAAKGDGAGLVVLPEMADTGYDMSVISETAASWDSGPFPALREAAKKHQITVLAGLSERVGADIFNTLALIGAEGQLISKYRKTHLITAEPICEQNTITPGDTL